MDFSTVFGIFVIMLFFLAVFFISGALVYLLIRFWYEIAIALCIGIMFFFVLFAATWAVFL